MTKKNRLIILMTCVIIFLIITPYIILYSLGYRIDFNNYNIITTGGIYVRAEPQGVNITVDSEASKKTGFFSNSAFVQNLLPKDHTVLVKKTGYFDYRKNITVEEKEVTKLENINLFKNNIAFKNISENAVYFSFSKDGQNIFLATKEKESKNNAIAILEAPNFQINSQIQWPAVNGTIKKANWSEDSSKIIIETEYKYFLFEPFSQSIKITLLPFLKNASDINFNPQNSNDIFFIKNKNLQIYNTEIYKNFTLEKIEIPIILKNVYTYQILDNKITWLSFDGKIYQSNLNTQSPRIQENILAVTPTMFNENKKYSLIVNSKDIFLKENKTLYYFDKNKKIFEEILKIANEINLSPDNQNIFYTSNNEIWIGHSNYDYQKTQYVSGKKILLNRFFETISDCFWLNNDYLLFKADDKIKISEIDNRGNINIIDLPIENSLDDKIFFNLQDKKLYILTGNNLRSSEKLLP